MELPYGAAFDPGTNQFGIARMVSKIGLLTIGAMADLRAAKARAKQLTESWPGEYIVFNRNTGFVVAKAGNKSQEMRWIG
jgi:hypothetical protein